MDQQDIPANHCFIDHPQNAVAGTLFWKGIYLNLYLYVAILITDYSFTHSGSSRNRALFVLAEPVGRRESKN